MQGLLRGPDLSPGIEPPQPISVTLIPATVFDNPALLRVNPEILAWLLSLPTLERERLLGGNWNVARRTNGADSAAAYDAVESSMSDNILMVMNDGAYHKGPRPRNSNQSRVAAE